MDDFAHAQKLFNEYEKHGAVTNLKESLEILDEIVDEKGPGSERATNFKNTIGKCIDTQIKQMSVKCNLKEFLTNLRNFDEITTFLSESLNEEDTIKLFQLFFIKVDYFSE